MGWLQGPLVHRILIGLATIAVLVTTASCRPSTETEPMIGPEEKKHFDAIKQGLDNAEPVVIEVSPCLNEDDEDCLQCDSESKSLKGLRVSLPTAEVDCFGLINREWCFDNRTKVRWIATDFPDDAFRMTLSIDAKDEQSQIYGSVHRNIARNGQGVWSRLPGRLTQDTEDWPYSVTVSRVGEADEYCADPEIRIHRRR
jgi:hypothetical protein